MTLPITWCHGGDASTLYRVGNASARCCPLNLTRQAREYTHSAGMIRPLYRVGSRAEELCPRDLECTVPFYCCVPRLGLYCEQCNTRTSSAGEVPYICHAPCRQLFIMAGRVAQ